MKTDLSKHENEVESKLKNENGNKNENIINNKENSSNLNGNNLTKKKEKFRLKIFLSSKKDGNQQISLFYCVRENGQYSFEKCSDINEDISSYFYLKIISEVNGDSNDDYLNENNDVKYKNKMKNTNDINSFQTDCIIENKINIQNNNNSEQYNTDEKEYQYSSSSRNVLSSEELRTFFEEGYLKVPSVVDEKRISACLR